MPTRPQRQDVIQELFARIDSLERDVRSLRNNKVMSVPIYSPASLPPLIDGQVYLVDADTFAWTYGGLNYQVTGTVF